MPHQGELLQEAIKLSGIPISKLVQDLGITRPTIYRKFRETVLDASFVTRVQDILGRSITPDTLSSVTPSVSTFTNTVTPAFTNSPSTVEEYANALIILQQKHIKLLEDYQALLTKLYTGR
jgi:hypothetical protein